MLRVASRLAAALLVVGCGLLPSVAAGRTTLRNICRVKGEEENVLQGLGIVVGLKGTGDGGNFAPTMRCLAQAMTVMGKPATLPELKDSKNVALVTVTATVPAGARQGDTLDCVVSSVGSAKSLQYGQLFLTPLVGPDRNNPRIFAFAQGPITLDEEEITTTGRVRAGCRLEEDFPGVFTDGEKITLVIDKNHADFQVAQDVAEAINSGQLSYGNTGVPLAKAINPFNVEVTIPTQYRDDPVMFVSLVRGLPILEPDPGARVTINERSGSIVISGDVEIGPVVVTHKNVVIQTGATAMPEPFVPIDPSQENVARLKTLVEALNAVQVPTRDVIDIIKGLDRNGKLHAKLIFE